MESTEFDGLILGLAEFVRRDGRYPYPELLRYALNKLAKENTQIICVLHIFTLALIAMTYSYASVMEQLGLWILKITEVLII